MRAIFLLVVAADVLDLLSTTVTNVAAPTTVRDLGASWSPAPRLGASYTLAMGSLMIVGGGAQAGSAGGVLNAVQQIVNAAGSAIASTVYLATVTPGEPSRRSALPAPHPGRHRGMRDEHPAASAPGSACPLSLPRFRRKAFACTSVPITGVFP
ncbi:hypothetical protein [Microbispora catharanthi]|uniref:Uncharacterized protein n=1 Tax=Microbispora catharanthi TaxID=1712871 RepID=A0A5N6BJ09_9ACTN|nr:hypothetical protein [Microbispora catharanthi]KAB8180432.1 hypothetical protein FH610_033120 [Microbispora catharanthi]